ncbi:MAG: T9SS type A sorting domain-containing protein [Chitinophagales bacterium]|nr:T9SS type A sorting domain-containing protein [Chitinophagales bacterium]
MKKILLPLFLLLIVNAASAQKQTWKWYFGYNAAMDFSTGAPVVLTNSAMSQWEGCASIADEDGNLLFYTSGERAWDKNHQVMANSTGMLGTSSSTQAALIVPKPGSATIYYIFVTSETGSAHYSEVDITLNGGLGDVNANKNITMANNVAEKLAGVRAANGTDVWVAVHENSSKKFKAFKVTSSGVNAAVSSTVGNTLSCAIGQLQFSPDGKRAAMCNCSPVNSATVELFDFDNATGIFSNQIPLTTTISQTYGLEFSPNSKVLYSGADGGINEVHQWDISLATATEIQASDLIIGYTQTNNVGSMQLAPDGKIYVAEEGSTYVGAISNPDLVGGATFDYYAVNLSPKSIGLGLPNFLASFFLPINAEFFCLGDATHFYLSDSAGFQSVYWNFDDPASGYLNTDSGTDVNHVFTDTGTYSVQVIETSLLGNVDTLYKTITIIEAPVVNLGNDTSLCIGDSLLIDAGNAGSSFVWNDGSTAQTLMVTAAGWYAVIVSNGSCTGEDSIFISYTNCNQFSVSDTNVCQKFCVNYFDLTLNSVEWHWTFEGGSPSTSILQNPTQICYNTPGVYDVTLITKNALGNSDTIALLNFMTVNATPALPTITQVGYVLTCSISSSYQWQFNSVDIPGATQQSYTATETGFYTVVIGNETGCVSSNTIYVLITGVEEISGNEFFNVYPNPSFGEFTVEFLNGQMPNATVTVTNALGQILFSSAPKNISMHSTLKVDLKNIAAGVYFLEIKSQNNLFNKKIIVTR